MLTPTGVRSENSQGRFGEFMPGWLEGFERRETYRVVPAFGILKGFIDAGAGPTVGPCLAP